MPPESKEDALVNTPLRATIRVLQLPSRIDTKAFKRLSYLGLSASILEKGWQKPLHRNVYAVCLSGTHEHLILEILGSDKKSVSAVHGLANELRDHLLTGQL
jgi:hypothetical protein